MEMKRLFWGLLICILVAPLFAYALIPSLDDDLLGLIVFKADIHDPQGKLESWNEDDDSPCLWKGVKCDPRSNRVSDLVLDGFSLPGKLGRGLLKLRFLRTLSLANNNLNGSLSLSLAEFPNLRNLDLSHNSLTGPLLDDFFQQCGSLRSLSLSKNEFSGSIPESLSSCSALVYLNLSSNQLSGKLPSKIWSLRGLKSVDLSDNVLDGEIPKDIEGMNNLRVINLQKNKFIGGIPEGIGACLLLRLIDLAENFLSGELPYTMQKLGFCTVLNLRKNLLSGQMPDWIGGLRSLESLDISGNNFSSKLPASIGHFTTLMMLNISTNAFIGSLPESMSNCKNLLVLDVSHNSFYGEIPSWAFTLGLQQLILSDNKFDGSLYNALSFSTENARQRLVALDVSSNSFSGEIPSGIGDFGYMQFLRLSRNLLSGGIPSSIGQMKSLSVLHVSENVLNGSIPSEIGGAKSLKELWMDKNLLVGNIPASIGNCSVLSYLSLSTNNISGPLPESMGELSYLQYVDLSLNKLTGTIPKQLANLTHLVYFNISHNQVDGELPAGAFFSSISPSSVEGNPGLCGYPLNTTCPTVLPKPIVLNPNSSASKPGSISQKFGHEKKILSISALIAIGAAIVIVFGVIAITVLNLHVRASASQSAAAFTFSGGDEFSHSPHTDASSGKLVMFRGDPEISSGAHALLNKDCEIGRGGFGTVYRTVLKGGRPVAIKKLAVASLVKSQDGFEREVQKLGKPHHENLVALEGYYWSSSLQLLIYEFIPGETLYKHLHEESGGISLSWNERFSIIFGIAKGLAYLHQMDIIHYNIKSSNILINGSGEPKVADFGLAKLLPMLDRYVLSSKIQSALGYMAPEFACKTVKITEKCDVYGFGVLLLEIVTGKRPVEYMEDDVVIICDMVRRALEDGKVEECVDGRLQGKFPVDEAIPIVKLGLICTSQVPSNRPNMAEVVNILEVIRNPSLSQDELV